MLAIGILDNEAMRTIDKVRRAFEQALISQESIQQENRAFCSIYAERDQHTAHIVPRSTDALNARGRIPPTGQAPITSAIEGDGPRLVLDALARQYTQRIPTRHHTLLVHAPHDHRDA